VFNYTIAGGAEAGVFGHLQERPKVLQQGPHAEGYQGEGREGDDTGVEAVAEYVRLVGTVQVLGEDIASRAGEQADSPAGTDRTVDFIILSGGYAEGASERCAAKVEEVGGRSGELEGGEGSEGPQEAKFRVARGSGSVSPTPWFGGYILNFYYCFRYSSYKHQYCS
jgi:hypothetical protein